MLRVFRGTCSIDITLIYDMQQYTIDRSYEVAVVIKLVCLLECVKVQLELLYSIVGIQCNGEKDVVVLVFNETQ